MISDDMIRTLARWDDARALDLPTWADAKPGVAIGYSDGQPVLVVASQADLKAALQAKRETPYVERFAILRGGEDVSETAAKLIQKLRPRWNRAGPAELTVRLPLDLLAQVEEHRAKQDVRPSMEDVVRSALSSLVERAAAPLIDEEALQRVLEAPAAQQGAREMMRGLAGLARFLGQTPSREELAEVALMARRLAEAAEARSGEMKRGKSAH